MKALFYPSSVVVFGVSAKDSNLGKEIAGNLFEFRYNGVIHFVGHEGGVIFGRKIHRSLGEITEPIDLAIILTPARTVPGIMAECGQKGIKRIVIESGGFGEFDQSGRNLGEELKAIAQQYGIRFIGPNCIGLMNSANGFTTPFTRLQNVFRKGGAAIIAQSGGVALTFLNMFDSEQLGFSKFATIGNKLDIDENDILEYLVEDPETKVICMYLESIRDGRRLVEIGRRSTKPIVVHKANIGSLSRTIAQSHTDALANDDQVVDAALSQAGMARFRDIQSYLDFVKILQLPSMDGRNLAIVSRSGGHAVMAADAAYTYGFKLPPFRNDFLTEIRKHLRADVIQLANPLDLGDLFDFDVYVRIIEHTLQEENIHGVLFLHTYFAAIEGDSSRRLLQSAASLSERYNKPVAICVYTEQYELSMLHKELDFPIFLSPERAVSALDSAIKHQIRRNLNTSTPTSYSPKKDMDIPSIKEILDTCIEQQRSPALHEALQALALAGLSVPQWRLITGSQDIEKNLSGFAGPYALKAVASGISHKTEAGGVILNLPDIDSLARNIDDMAAGISAHPSSGLKGFLVQEMIPASNGAYELILGGKRDPYFGPVVMLGHGGVLVEILGKVCLRLAPLCDTEIESMIQELPSSEILDGIRGKPPVDKASLKTAIEAVANLMVNFDQIESVDVNPIVVSASGTLALDARIFLSIEGDHAAQN